MLKRVNSNAEYYYNTRFVILYTQLYNNINIIIMNKNNHKSLIWLTIIKFEMANLYSFILPMLLSIILYYALYII